MTPPRGPDAVRAALLEAAVAVYAAGERFSAREIARRAGVNHGQVHHLFGGRQGLKRAMLEHLAAAQADALPANAPPAALLRAAAEVALADPRFARVLARALLEQAPGAPPPQERFPVVDRLRASLEGTPYDRAALAEGLATALGFALFGPWIRQAVGASVDPLQTVDRQLAAAFGPAPKR